MCLTGPRPFQGTNTWNPGTVLGLLSGVVEEDRVFSMAGNVGLGKELGGLGAPQRSRSWRLSRLRLRLNLSVYLFGKFLGKRDKRSVPRLFRSR